MNEPLFHVGQKVAVFSRTPCCGQMTVIPLTEVLDVIHMEYRLYGCGNCRNPVAGIFSGFAYIVAGQEGFFFKEPALRPIDPEQEYLEVVNELECQQ